MEVKLDSLAKQFEKMNKKDFLKKYSFPWLVQKRNYKTGSQPKGNAATSRIDVETIQNIVSDSEGIQEFPDAVIALRPRVSGKLNAPFSLGRDKPSDIILNLPQISKTHIYFSFNSHDKHFQVADAGSTNDTHLNFKKLPAKEWTPLYNGDLICLAGIYNFVFYDAERMGKYLSRYLDKKIGSQLTA